MTTLNINGQSYQVDVPLDTPLLWVLRDILFLTGTKYGCGIAVCWACTVHVNGKAEKSCDYTVGAAAGKTITTIEGLSPDGTHPLQKTWIAEQAPQCGCCQSGMLMQAAALLLEKPHPSDGDINAAMKNVCVCGTYQCVKESPADEVLAMATVVKVRGSAYRRPGARMLMNADGPSAGMISGGCLENDARERARDVMQTGEPVLVTYDSTAPDDIVFGLGLGCNGIVQVLIKPLIAGDEAGLLAFLAACVARRQIGRIATVFQSDDFPPGARLMRWPDGSVTSNFNDGILRAALLKAFQENASRRTAIRTIELPDGRAAGVLLEAVPPPVPLMVFGAADDAIPVVQLAKSIGWQVTVVDARPAYATAERFPNADAVLCLRPEALLTSPHVVIPPESMVVIMTHSFTRDRELLRVLLPRAPRYIGVLGPKSRTDRLLGELADEGVAFPQENLARLHGPAGLDIGAETPEEIAVSIIGEMQAVLAQRDGGALRDRTAPIHDPTEQHLTSP